MRVETVQFDGFDWDGGNVLKVEARVPREMVEEFFCQEILIKEDIGHSHNEKRFIALGYTKEPRRCLFVAFTIRYKGEEILIRPISARYTHKKEEKAYEAEIKKLKETN